MSRLTAAIALALALLAACTNSNPWEPPVIAIKCSPSDSLPGKIECREVPVDSIQGYLAPAKAETTVAEAES